MKSQLEFTKSASSETAPLFQDPRMETSQDEKEPENQKDEGGPEAIFSNMLSRLIFMLPLDSIKNVYSAFQDKRVKNTFPIDQVEEYYSKLLYEDGFAENFISSPEFKRKGTKSIPPTKEEEFFITMTRRFHGARTAHILTNEWRNKLLLQHSDTQIKKIVDSLSTLDQQKMSALTAQYANQIAHEEASAIGEQFSEEELEIAGVSQEDLNWWRQSFHIPEEKPVAAEIDNSKLCDLKIEQAEKAIDFLTQSTTPYFGTFSSIQDDYLVASKHFLIHDGNYPDIDINLKDIPNYEPHPSCNYGALLMFKDDLEFYVENVGSAPLIIDAIPLKQGETTYIKDNACFEFGEATLVFKINWSFVGNIKRSPKL